MTTVTIDALDAFELAEILEYIMERLDILAEHDLARLLFAECSPAPTASTTYEQTSPGSSTVSTPAR
jgi:hypothetical protein